MEIAWSDEPDRRPTFDHIKKMLKKANPSKKHVIDSVIETMETYTLELEEKYSTVNKELMSSKDDLKALVGTYISRNILQKLLHNNSFSVQNDYQNLTLGVLTINNSKNNFLNSDINSVVETLEEIDRLLDKHFRKMDDCSRLLLNTGEFGIVSGITSSQVHSKNYINNCYSFPIILVLKIKRKVPLLIHQKCFFPDC